MECLLQAGQPCILSGRGDRYLRRTDGVKRPGRALKSYREGIVPRNAIILLGNQYHFLVTTEKLDTRQTSCILR